MNLIKKLDIKEYNSLSCLDKKGGLTEVLDKMMNKLDEIVKRVNILTLAVDSIAEGVLDRTENE